MAEGGEVWEDEEPQEEYREGGYHQVTPGDMLGDRSVLQTSELLKREYYFICHIVLSTRYRVESKLGWGAFSTVWRCRKVLMGSMAMVAVKVLKSDVMVRDSGEDEVELLEAAGRAGGGKWVVGLVERFEVSGPHGFHLCLALELLGPNLLDGLTDRGIHMDNVKAVIRQVLEGLDFLHTKPGIIHTDIKPENVLLAHGYSGRRDLLQPLAGLRVKLGDLGSACWVRSHFSAKIGTRQYRAPEVLLLASYGPPVDVWATACLAFELATGQYLLNPEGEARCSREERHLALMVELLGRLPEELVREGQLARDYYNRAGELHHHPGLGFTTSLAARLLEFHRWGLEAAASFAGFLLPMLATKPGVRATAGQARAHAFLGDGVVVEEVEEVAKKAEEAKEEAVEEEEEGEKGEEGEDWEFSEGTREEFLRRFVTKRMDMDSMVEEVGGDEAMETSSDEVAGNLGDVEVIRAEDELVENFGSDKVEVMQVDDQVEKKVNDEVLDTDNDEEAKRKEESRNICYIRSALLKASYSRKLISS